MIDNTAMRVNHNSHKRKNREEAEPIISVVMITFNQERYIRKAIEGVLFQKTDLAYELIIADDCSTDKTRDICIEYQEKYPDVIRLILREANLGIQQNFINTIKVAQGKYIALCDGDDYWVDPYKLQRQYELLESNTQASGIHTRVEYCDLNDQIIASSFFSPKDWGSVDLNYLLQRNMIHTCSFMFRRNILDETVFSVLEQSPIQDYTLFLLTALRGEILYLPMITAVYRKNAGVTRSWQFRDTLYNHLIIFSILKKNYKMNKYRSGLYAAKHFHYYHLLSATRTQNNILIKCKYGSLLFYYGVLSSLAPPSLQARKAGLCDSVALLIKMRPKIFLALRRFLLYIKSLLKINGRRFKTRLL